jgi:3-deoxy-D-manno-octulosonic-acid transferase
VHPLLRLSYLGAAHLARAAAALAGNGDAKTTRALRARRGIVERYRTWAREHRDDSRPLLWMHAPSVGEGLQARPVLQRLRTRRPDVQLAYTFFSPSAESFARSLPVDFAEYLPFDTPVDTSASLDALRPSALVFSKLDVWPTLVAEASHRHVRLGLISGTVSQSSGRNSSLARALLGDAYGALDAVGAVDQPDATRLIALGVRASSLRITGDTRYDQVWARAAEVDRDGALLVPLRSSRATLVAGSTWPSDERHLLDAWHQARARHPEVRLIIAPHEPTEEHCASIERWASAQSIATRRLSAANASADLVLVDRVGVLGELYALATMAFVGGGFHSAGLHSVLEPAAFGAPVLFGPGGRTNRDAVLLRESGGGVEVDDTPALTTQLDTWLSDDGARARAGAAARETVQRGLGAAERSLALVESLLERRGAVAR